MQKGTPDVPSCIRHALPEYLANKLERRRRARVSNLVFCIDADRNLGDGDVPASAAVVRYRRRVDAAKVLEIVAATEPAT